MGFFKKGELSLLWPFYLEYFIASILFFMPAFSVVYFLSIGLSAFQIGILLAVWPLSSLIFEIPTGAFADLYGRKASVILGYSLEALVMISLFFWRSFNLMVLSFALLGLAVTFSSGSKDAWIVDLIKRDNKKLVHGFFTKMQFFINSGLIISGILGSILVRLYGLRIIWLVAFISYVLSITLLSLFTRDITTANQINKNSNLKNSFFKLRSQTKQSLSYSRHHSVLFYFIFAETIVIFAIALQGSLSWTPLFQELGMKDYYFGYLWSIFALIKALAPFVGTRLVKRGKERNFIILGEISWAIIMLPILLAFNLLFAFMIFLISSFFYFMKLPTEETYFHKFVPSKLRATVGSIRNMFFSLSVVIVSPIQGFLIDSIGPRKTLFISALLVIPAVFLYLKIKEKK